MLLENVQRKETPGLKMIILMDAFDAQLVEEGQKCGVHIQALKDVEVRHLLILISIELHYYLRAGVFSDSVLKV